MTIGKITSSEVKAYEDFSIAYNRILTYMDPVFGLLNNEKKSTGEQLELKLNISPYARTRYRNLDMYLGEPKLERIATIPGDLVFIEAQLKNFFILPNMHFFGGIRDMDLPFSIKHGVISRDYSMDNMSFTKFYAGITPYTRKLIDILGQKSRPDAKGYAKLDAGRWLDDAWTRTFDKYYVIGTGRSLLETVTPNIRIEKADNPSQVSLSLNDLSKTLVGNYLRTEAYTRSRQTSAGNALLLHAYQQQLQPNDLDSAIKAVQNQSLICPLGGNYVPADKEQPDRWKSTVWAEETLYQTNQLPETYRQVIVDEIKTMRLEFSISPDTLKTRLFIQTNSK
jgi:hypothetical protein